MRITMEDIRNIGVFGKLAEISPALWILGFVLCALTAYLLGSLNFALVLTNWLKKDDIRQYGSGNAGMTNMLRTFGKGAAAATLFGDAAKSALSALVGTVFCGEMGAYVAGLFCIIGHVYPVFFNFKGGKGVVASFTMILCLNPLVCLLLLILFVAIVALTKYLSLGSIMVMLVYPLLLYRLSPEPNAIKLIFSIFIALFVVFLHRENIKRLLSGTENKFTLKTRGSKNAKKGAQDPEPKEPSGGSSSGAEESAPTSDETDRP